MPDISLNTNDTGVPGGDKPKDDSGLLDAPAKSALEQSGVSASNVESNPAASSAMPEASPSAPIAPSTPPATDQPPQQEETAAVPDTDKFLESILENNNKTASSPTDSPASVGGGSDIDVDTSTSPLEQQTTTPTPEPSEASEIPVPNQEQSPDEQPKIKDDIRGLNAAVNGIAAPSEPSKPVSDDPVGAMQGKKPSGGSSKTIILIVLVVALGVGGYLVYNYMFANNVQTSGVSIPAIEATKTAQLTNDATRKQDLAKIHVALKSYLSATGKYPVSAERVPLNTTNNILEKELVGANYINMIPSDPDVAKYYAYKSDGVTFSLTALLDDTTDPEAKLSGTVAIYEVNQDSTVTTSPNSVTQTATPIASTSDDTTVQTDASLNPWYPSGTATAVTSSSAVASSTALF